MLHLLCESVNFHHPRHGERVHISQPAGSNWKAIWSRTSVLVSNVLLLLLAFGLSSCSLLGPLLAAALPLASAKLYFACIPEHTLVDTPSGPRPIEKLEAGDSVIGFGGKPVRILQKHSYMENPGTVFLHITFADGAVVDLCGMHRIAGIRAGEIQTGRSIAGRNWP